MRRRGFLLGAAGLATALLPASAVLPAQRLSGSRLDALRSAIRPEIDFLNAHTRERLSGSFFHAAGYDATQLDKVDWFMRDWRQNETLRTDPRLLWALAAIRQAAQADGHSGEIVVLSGYRTQKTNEMLRAKGLGAARNSFHLKARAVDFVLPDAPVDLVARYMRWLQVGGTGHYPGSFIHVDTGPERAWNG